MTYEQYWYGEAWLVGAFLEADRLRQIRKDEEAWLQGMYFYDALTKVSPLLHAFAKNGTKAGEYPDKPYLSKEKEVEKEKRDEIEALQAELYMRNMMRIGKSWNHQKEVK